MTQDPPNRLGRRLAAILAADAAAYSRLMHDDEEDTHIRLAALLTGAAEPAIAEHGGRIVKHTGDGFLAEFPSAVGAVRAAAHFQSKVQELTIGTSADKRILFRVGINIGDVIVEEHDIFGDGVNIAARLEGIAEPGGICISSSAYDQVRGKVELEFVDIGEQKLKNISRPVRVYAVVQGAGTSRGSSDPAIVSNPAPRLSIVVLPFSNIGGDPEQDYFVDGVTESLTTDLSRIAGTFVIARNSAFSYKGKSIDVRQVGRELNVRYVLEGSVQRSGNRFRVNVQLIASETGNHIWAERFDKPVADLFDVQDEIVSRLANTLTSQIVQVEAQRANVLRQFRGCFFEGHEDAGFFELGGSAYQELHGQQSLARARAAADERGTPARKTASCDFIQPLNASRRFGQTTISLVQILDRLLRHANFHFGHLIFPALCESRRGPERCCKQHTL